MYLTAWPGEKDQGEQNKGFSHCPKSFYSRSAPNPECPDFAMANLHMGSCQKRPLLCCTGSIPLNTGGNIFICWIRKSQSRHCLLKCLFSACKGDGTEMWVVRLSRAGPAQSEGFLGWGNNTSPIFQEMFERDSLIGKRQKNNMKHMIDMTQVPYIFPSSVSTFLHEHNN